ncbi:MAG: exodeoxyribonuclease VII small subunit [Acidimicrobiaceae bacterium]|jgi:exodeoxyribonuclease VII small subunit|nr:exodeoxyribonuclease VII small subunit [Acidimicrobiaceae bacterium]|tara:strand:+ start:2073 stop:2276 length:204 start_codon:yes stop_codon:yes gene_type:complete
MTEKTLTFQAAMEELELILRKLDSEEVNIDSLTVDLRRASELIEWCRSRLETTRVEVERIVTDLEES